MEDIAALPPGSASLFSVGLKILILQDRLRSGGTERQSILLTKGLLANGLDAQLVTFRPGGALASAAAGLPGGALQQPDRGWDWYSPGLVVRLRRERPDAVLAMGRMANCRLGWLNAGRAVKIATFRTGKPLPWLYRRALRTAGQVIANSAEAARTLQDTYGVPGKKIAVIYNGLIFPAAVGYPFPGASGHPRRLAARGELGAGPGTTVFLCVAMFRPEKRQAELVEILAGLQAGLDWQLWLAGDGPARAACERRVRELGLSDRVKFTGFRADPSELYAGADAAVLASESEALSNFLIEAQAHGLPAIAYDAQGVAECFAPDRTGRLIRREDRDAFRAAAERVLRALPAERENWRAGAVHFARERFDADRQIGAYVDLLRRLQSDASS
jgi:glycosyltransferase involved in cell wall biosynthesis